MKILLLVPFLLGNSASPAGAAVEGLIALFVVFAVFGLICWGAVKIFQRYWK
jgi:TRAP-type C4-dicarboxylate transport system permease small subunit